MVVWMEGTTKHLSTRKEGKSEREQAATKREDKSWKTPRHVGRQERPTSVVGKEGYLRPAPKKHESIRSANEPDGVVTTPTSFHLNGVFRCSAFKLEFKSSGALNMSTKGILLVPVLLLVPTTHH